VQKAELGAQPLGLGNLPVLPTRRALLLGSTASGAGCSAIEIRAVSEGKDSWNGTLPHKDTPLPYVAQAAAWRSDGLEFAAFVNDQLFVANLDQAEHVRSLDSRKVVGRPMFPPDGARLAVMSRGRVFVLDMASGAMVLDRRLRGRVLDVWFGSGGSQLLIAQDEGPPAVPAIARVSIRERARLSQFAPHPSILRGRTARSGTRPDPAGLG